MRTVAIFGRRSQNDVADETVPAALVGWRRAVDQQAARARQCARRFDSQADSYSTPGRALAAIPRLTDFLRQVEEIDASCNRLQAMTPPFQPHQPFASIDRSTGRQLQAVVDLCRQLRQGLAARRDGAMLLADDRSTRSRGTESDAPARDGGGLASCSISAAKIPGIGRTTVDLLAACGYRTAADFVGGGVDILWNGYGHEHVAYLIEPDGQKYTIRGLGPERVRALLAWRDRMAARRWDCCRFG